MKSIHRKSLLLALAGAISIPVILMSVAQAQPTYPGYGPGTWQPMTPQQRQQMWEYMNRQGYGPGMMGPGMWQQLTPEQRQQMWDYMNRQGYGPGMMTGPGMMGQGMGQRMTPEQYKQWWDQTHAAAPEKK